MGHIESAGSSSSDVEEEELDTGFFFLQPRTFFSLSGYSLGDTTSVRSFGTDEDYCLFSLLPIPWTNSVGSAEVEIVSSLFRVCVCVSLSRD